MARPDSGVKPARMFRWQMMSVSQEYQNELELEPLSVKVGGLLFPPGLGGGKVGHFHRGVDIACPVGTPIRLVLSGVLSLPKRDDAGFGLSVQCDGLRYRTTYGHLSVVRVVPGQRGIHGDLVALSGSTGNSTGPHVHFEVWDKVGMAWVDPWSVV